MSPEQAVDSGTVNPRADVYSLGCTLYFLLVGRPPYAGGSLMAVMLKHRDAPIPSLRGTRPDVPPELDAIFARMVAKRPADRFETMGEVIRQLEQVRSRLLAAGAVSAGQPAPAAPTAVPDRTVALESPLAAAGRDTSSFEVVPAEGAAPVMSQLTHLTVVIAEPSRTQDGIIRNYLRQLGIESVHSTGSGREAVATAKRLGAGVLISSLHLSDMTGVDLAVALRADSECQEMGFVLATSETHSETLARLPQDSCTAVVPKPFDLPGLTRSIASVVA